MNMRPLSGSYHFPTHCIVINIQIPPGLKNGVDPILAGGNTEYPCGNGSLMRIMPLLVLTISKNSYLDWTGIRKNSWRILWRILWRKTKKPLKIRGLICLLAVRTGLEPATPCVTGTYSNQLNYRTNIVKNVLFSLKALQR